MIHQKIKIGGTPIQPGDPRSLTSWKGDWLRDPIFEGVEYRELIHPNRNTENNGKIQNIHTLFRRELELEEKEILDARLYITADDCYKLYINGIFIGIGPAPAYPADFPYNAWDVTANLQTGKTNCIGVHTFYHGMHSLTFPSGDNLQGLLLQLEVDFKDGSSINLSSESNWQCYRTDAYESKHVIGYQTAFSEYIDLRKFPNGWNRIGFDDSKWQKPLSGPIPEYYNLSPQQTTPVDVFKRTPERIAKKGDGHYFIDFGSEMSGGTVFTVTGPSGHEVEIRHGEETDGPDSVRYDMRCNCLYQEICTLSGRQNECLEFYDYKGFRYVEVLNWPEELTEDRIWANERHYPMQEEASSFTSSNPLLNEIWELCRNGVRVGTLDTYLDCPTREKGGFMGDGFVTGISHLITSGDPRIMRKFLKDVASTRVYCPGLLSTAPNYVNGELAEYSFLWPVLLEYYYQWTADLEFVKDMMPVFKGLLEYYAEYENEEGLLQDLFSHNTKRYSVLVDWPNNLRDGYDDPFLMGNRTVEEDPEGVVNTMVQGFYSNCLQASERLAKITDSTEIKRHLSGRKDRLHNAVLNQLRNPEMGLFVDRNGSDHSALHANISPLMAGMIKQDDKKEVIEFIQQKRLGCGVYFSFFVLKALFDYGEYELAYDLITSQDLHSWNSMLEAGATTCMEAWSPDLKWNTSWCHPWSSAPIHMIAHEIMGLRPAKPGWKQISFIPKIPRDLDSASLTMTIPQGKLKVSFRQTDDSLTYDLNIPEGCTAICRLGQNIKNISSGKNRLSVKKQCLI
jgi:alpha-L-rhamnosidase